MSHLGCVFSGVLIVCLTIGAMWCGIVGAWWGVAIAIGITAAIVWIGA